jgi:hypothetical protein
MGNNPSTLGVRPRVGGFIMPRSGRSKVKEVKEATAASRQWQEWQRRSDGSGGSEEIKKESLRAEPCEAWQSSIEIFQIASPIRSLH